MLAVLVAVVGLAVVAVLLFLAHQRGLFTNLFGQQSTSSQDPIDTPKSPPTYGAASNDGGPVGLGIREALEDAGFGCDRVEGSEDAMVMCYRSQPKPAPTIQRVRMTVADHDVARVQVTVGADPAWQPLSKGGVDVRQSANEVFETIAGYTALGMSKEDILEFRTALHQAATAGSAKFEAGQTFGTITLGRSDAEFSFSPSHEANLGGGYVLEPGLTYLTPKELENAVTKAGLTCTRADDSSMCEKSGVSLKVAFPVTRGSEEQRITTVTLTGPASGDGRPSPALVGAAREVAGTIGGKFGDEEFARTWASRCFQRATRQTVLGDSEATCRPTLTGSAGAPTPKSYTFSVSDIKE